MIEQGRGGQSATCLGVCNATVYRLCESGQLPHVWIVNSIRIRPDDLKVFLASRSRAPGRRDKRNRSEDRRRAALTSAKGEGSQDNHVTNVEIASPQTVAAKVEADDTPPDSEGARPEQDVSGSSIETAKGAASTTAVSPVPPAKQRKRKNVAS
jgi:hypothetical protein